MPKTTTISTQTNPEIFIDRQEELAMLKKLYEKTETRAQFLVLYGKRRVGKTELVKHFFADKPHLYYLAAKVSAQDQLKTISALIADYFDESYLKTKGFANWRDLFDYLGKKLKASQERLVLVIDEFPFLAEQEPGISSYFQYGWDEHLKNTHVFLILLGSSLSMMYRHALIYSAPLYGRRTASYCLEPFTFSQAKNFYHSDDFEKVFSFYAMAGGVPAYLKEFNEEKSLWVNIAEKILTKGTLLYSEPELLIADDIKEPAKYLTLLKAIGLGRTKFAEIINTSGLASNLVSKYLSVLTKLRWVKREVPVTEKNPEKSKKGIYTLADNYFRFYYHFIFPYLSALESERKEFFLKKIKEGFPYFVSKIYEEAAPEFIKELWQKGRTPFFPRLGRFWDKETEIDLVGLNQEENSILLVEAKWNQKPLLPQVLLDLKKKAQRVNWGKPGRKEYFVLMAKGGFSKELIKTAKKEEVFLIAGDRLARF